MPELKQIFRSKIILDELSSMPAGCSINQLTSHLQAKYPAQEWNSHTVRRDIADLQKVGWLENLESNFFISPALGEYYFRRYQAVAERARKPLEEMQAMFNRIGKTFSPNSREDVDVKK